MERSTGRLQQIRLVTHALPGPLPAPLVVSNNGRTSRCLMQLLSSFGVRRLLTTMRCVHF